MADRGGVSVVAGVKRDDRLEKIAAVNLQSWISCVLKLDGLSRGLLRGLERDIKTRRVAAKKPKDQSWGLIF